MFSLLCVCLSVSVRTLTVAILMKFGIDVRNLTDLRRSLRSSIDSVSVKLRPLLILEHHFYRAMHFNAKRGIAIA